MANEKELRKSALADWENELAYQKKVLADKTASEDLKKMARDRIKLCETWIKKIKAM